MKKFLILFTVLILTGFLVCQAQAGQILKATSGPLTPFSTYPSTASSYKTALEIYNPAITATSSTTGIVALNFAQTEVSGGSVTEPVTVTFRFTDGDASFAVAGPNFVWVLTNDRNLTSPNRDVYAASSVGAVGPVITLSSNNVNCASNFSGNCNIPFGTNLWLVQAIWSDTNLPSNVNGRIDVGLNGTTNELSNPTNVSANLINKSADCNTRPVWPLSASISGTNGNIQFPVVSFTYVTPQIAVTTNPASGSLNAELNSDTDFKTFVLGSGDNVTSNTTIYDNLATNLGFYFVTNLQAAETWNWIAWAAGPTCSLTFDLQSVNAEPGVSSITFYGNPCTETTQDKVWRCSSGAFSPTPTKDLDLVLNVDGTTINNPTIWSVNNLTATGIRCYNSNPRTVGVWYGGVEALVPFVKSDPAVGAQTYVVFYNRRDVDVPVYAKALINDASQILISTNPIATIPANSKIQFTADQLKTLLPELASYDMSKGIPIKFMFRIPSQSITNTISGTAVPDTAGTIGADTQINISGKLTNVNPLDPYIEGIVVSVYGSQHRSVPLKFKFFKQGS
jgi:hypothetical protein